MGRIKPSSIFKHFPIVGSGSSISLPHVWLHVKLFEQDFFSKCGKCYDSYAWEKVKCIYACYPMSKNLANPTFVITLDITFISLKIPLTCMLKCALNTQTLFSCKCLDLVLEILVHRLWYHRISAGSEQNHDYILVDSRQFPHVRPMIHVAWNILGCWCLEQDL